MLAEAKKALRINNGAYDNEISDLISSAKQDLALAGVAPSLIDENDPLIKRAIINYCKSEFGLDNSESEKYKKSYDLLKQHLAIAYSEDTKEIKKLIIKEIDKGEKNELI